MRGLYPIVSLTGPGVHVFPSGALAALALHLPAGGVWRIAVAHVAPRQDHSVRAWISGGETPGGAAMAIAGFGAASVWHPNRTPDEVAYLHDRDIPRDPAWGIAVASVPGNWWLNLLNLANGENACSVDAILTTA